MQKKTEKNLTQLEDWLSVLVNTYLAHPNNSLAKTISFNIKQIMQFDDSQFLKSPRCEYVSMWKYWHWLSNQKTEL